MEPNKTDSVEALTPLDLISLAGTWGILLYNMIVRYAVCAVLNSLIIVLAL